MRLTSSVPPVVPSLHEPQVQQVTSQNSRTKCELYPRTAMDKVLLASSTREHEAQVLVCPTSQSPAPTARRHNNTQAPDKHKKNASLQSSAPHADQGEAPPSYEKAMASLASTLEGATPTRVAALPQSSLASDLSTCTTSVTFASHVVVGGAPIPGRYDTTVVSEPV